MQPNDPLGHRLLQDRISQCPQIIQNMLKVQLEPQIQTLPKHFTVTGIGSSEAHGKFFADLIDRYTTSSASFLKLSNFYGHLNKKSKPSKSILVVFSQGLSPNSLLAINQRTLFKSLILFTSTTESNPVHVHLIKKLKSERNSVIHFPLENEYTLLIRLIGPLAGYLAVIQFLQQYTTIPACDHTALINSIHEAKKNIPSNALDNLADMKNGSIFLVPPHLSNYAQNLAYKFLEGLFLPMPTIVDYLSFSHGYFQQLISDPKPIVIFKENTIESKKLHAHAKMMLLGAKTKIIEINSKLPTPWNVFEFEATLNQLILEGILKWNINQISWPGKNLDHTLYDISEPET